METGDEVGTQSRARAIAMNPLTVLAAGAAVVLAGELLLPAVAIGSVEAAGTVTVVEGAAVIAETAAVVGEEAAITANAIRGAQAEARVLADMALSRNTSFVMTEEGAAVPDALTDSLSVEIKDAIRVSYTKQVRIQTQAAKAAGRESWLVTGLRTRVSRRATEPFDQILRRSDLGPK